MPNNVGPGKLDKVGVTSGIAEHPAVVPELVALTEVVRDDPPLRFVVVLPCCPFVGEFPHLVVQRVEHLGRHHTPVIGGPPLDDRVEPGDDRRRVRSAQDAHLEREPLPEPPDGRLARFDQQLGAVPADVESQEIESLLTEVNDLRLVLVEDQTPGRQHSASCTLICSACSPEWQSATRSSAYLITTGDPGLVSPEPVPGNA